MPRCLQNLTCLKYVCSSQWTSTLHTAKNAEYTVFLRLGSSPSNPAYNTVDAKFKASFPSKPNQIPTLGIHIAPELEKIGFKRNTVSRLSIPGTRPCLLRHPEIDLSLHSSDKAVTPSEVFKVRFYELCDRFKNFYHIHTDCSKMGHRVSSALCHQVRQLFGCRVQQASSVRNFTLSCLPWMLSKALKKNTFSSCQTHMQVWLRWKEVVLTRIQFINILKHTPL